jgi:hypothetical protein
MSQIPAESIVLKARRVSNQHQAAFAPPPIAEVVAAIHDQRPDLVFAPHVETVAGMILPDDYLRAVADAVHAVGGLFVLDCIASGAIWVDMAAIIVDLLDGRTDLSVNAVNAVNALNAADAVRRQHHDVFYWFFISGWRAAHQPATASRAAASRCKPSLLRRHSTSSALRAHSCSYRYSSSTSNSPGATSAPRPPACNSISNRLP